MTTIAGSCDYGDQSQKYIGQRSCPYENCCRWRGSWWSKHDCWQEYRISGASFWCWDQSHHLQYCWYRLRWETAEERDSLYHFKWTDVVQEAILHPLDWVCSLVAGIWCSGAPENNWTACNTFRLPKDASFEPYIRVNLANGFLWQFHNQYFWIATYQKCERGISIH